MSALNILLLIVNEKMYVEGMIDQNTKDSIYKEIINGLNNNRDGSIIDTDLAPSYHRRDVV